MAIASHVGDGYVSLEEDPGRKTQDIGKTQDARRKTRDESTGRDACATSLESGVLGLEPIDESRVLSLSDDPTTSLLEELVVTLEVELDQYRDLLDMLRTQREHFVTGDVAAFEEISKRQGTVVLKIKTLEEARKSIVRSLAQHFGSPQESFTLAELAMLVDEPYSVQCIALREQILSLIRSLENLRESNAYLMQHALHYISGVLRIFASSSNHPHAHKDTSYRVSTDSYSSSGQLRDRLKDTGKGRHVSGWG